MHLVWLDPTANQLVFKQIQISWLFNPHHLVMYTPLVPNYIQLSCFQQLFMALCTNYSAGCVEFLSSDEFVSKSRVAQHSLHFWTAGSGLQSPNCATSWVWPPTGGKDRWIADQVLNGWLIRCHREPRKGYFHLVHWQLHYWQRIWRSAWQLALWPTAAKGSPTSLHRSCDHQISGQDGLSSRWRTQDPIQCEGHGPYRHSCKKTTQVAAADSDAWSTSATASLQWLNSGMEVGIVGAAETLQMQKHLPPLQSINRGALTTAWP